MIIESWLFRGISKVSKILKKGAGLTWPGYIALKLKPKLISSILSSYPLGTIYISATNGKTTTNHLLHSLLLSVGINSNYNSSGANLQNGIASSLISDLDVLGKLKSSIVNLEVDENYLPKLSTLHAPNVLVLGNIFRDQLDRYGEVQAIVENWRQVILNLPLETKLVFNSDDPSIYFLSTLFKGEKFSFSLRDFFNTLNSIDNKYIESHSDTALCPNCGEILTYSQIFFAHYSIFKCPKCKLTNENIKSSLTLNESLLKLSILGKFNIYNALSALTTMKALDLYAKSLLDVISNIESPFGRGEKIIIEDRELYVFLSKNPSSMSQSIQTAYELNPEVVIFGLNDNIADGKDISWIWDISFPHKKIPFAIACGNRYLDMALRLQYEENTKSLCRISAISDALTTSIRQTKSGDKIAILCTYTAMLEFRKYLIGKSIL